MATNYPTNLDTLINPTATNKVSVVSHADQHANANDGIEALQAKVGVNGSAVTTSHDFKLSGVTGSLKASTVTGVETLTNKTLTAPIIATISNTGIVTLPTATDTLVARATADTLTNKTLTSPVLNGTLTGTAFLDQDDMISNSATATASQQSIKTYVDNAVSSGVPNSFGMSAVFNNVSFTDEFFNTHTISGSTLRLATETTGKIMNTVPITGTWADADDISVSAICFLNGYMYITLQDFGTAPDTRRVYRYDLANITANGTQMSFAGATVLVATDSAVEMACDGTNFYFSFNAGNSANQFSIAKYTLSGTTLTYNSTITLSDSATFDQGFAVDTVGNIFTINSSAIKRYNNAGAIEYTTVVVAYDTVLSFSGTIYGGDNAPDRYDRLYT